MWSPLLTTATGPPDWTWLTQAGSVGILAAAVIAFMRGWIVSGTHYQQVCSERDRALEQVYKGNEIAQRALEAAERKAVV